MNRRKLVRRTRLAEEIRLRHIFKRHTEQLIRGAVDLIFFPDPLFSRMKDSAQRPGGRVISSITYTAS
jgi:hypothetical protein